MATRRKKSLRHQLVVKFQHIQLILWILIIEQLCYTMHAVAFVRRHFTAVINLHVWVCQMLYADWAPCFDNNCKAGISILIVNKEKLWVKIMCYEWHTETAANDIWQHLSRWYRRRKVLNQSPFMKIKSAVVFDAQIHISLNCFYCV